MSIKASEISDLIQARIKNFDAATEARNVGTVVSVTDGICRVHGLADVAYGEMLEFPDNSFGLALNLEQDSVGAVVLGEYRHIGEGATVKTTGRILEVPVGPEMLGRVVDALGNPLDGKGPIKAAKRSPIERVAPGVIWRKSVGQPVQTGLKAIDSMVPIGRGQRELIIGDRQTGKTAIAIDTIIAQRDDWASGDPKKQVKCIYVAVGQKSSTVAEVVEALRENGALEYTVVVNAPASDPAPFQYVAPYAGAALGAHWMYEGQHALAIYDDLSKQATAYRTLSLLLRRPPGREAYPGDVFYLHSRLLERAAKLSDELGGGSLTALPIIETKGGDVSAYIPTNVISITDGQIYLEPELFYAGVRPAINVGISVSRVGGNAQIKAMKKVAGRLRLDLAQYRALEAFAQFGSELDKASQQQLARGARVVEVLKQPQYRPVAVERQVVHILAATGGHLDEYPVEDAKRFVEGLAEFVDMRKPDVMAAIRGSGDLSEETEAAMKAAIEEFKQSFVPSSAVGGAEGGIGKASAPDEVKPDVGWERMSSVEEDGGAEE